MMNWWNALPTLEQFFYLLAIPGTLILILQTVLLLFGLGHGSDADHDMDMNGDGGADVGWDHDTDMDADADTDGDLGDHTFGDHDSDHDTGAEHASGLRLLSVRGIVAFLAVCGWVGVASLDSGASAGLASVLAVVAGLGAMVLVALLLKWSLRLQQSGNLDLNNAVGLTAEVYVSLKNGAKGKVTLVLQERFTELDAVCPTADCAVGSRVMVTDVTETGTLIVAPL